jgi:hypothetical protein
MVRSSFAVVGVVVALLVSIAAGVYQSPVVTMVGVRKDQPIPFSHQRHVGGNGMDCRYCHTSVEHSRFAGIPPTETCMTCHSQILTDAPMLQPVHQSWKSGEPIEWNRIYDLPDFAYFDHSAHIAKGVGCTTCHGNIQEQRLTHKATTLHMAWCLQCHKAPEKFLRPKDKVFDPEWTPPADQLAQGRMLLEKHDVKVGQLMDCSVCHR